MIIFIKQKGKQEITIYYLYDSENIFAQNAKNRFSGFRVFQSPKKQVDLSSRFLPSTPVSFGCGPKAVEDVNFHHHHRHQQQ